MKGIFEKKTLGIISRVTDKFMPYAPMFHAHAEIVYVVSGNITVTVDGVKKTLEAGEAGVCFPYSIHSYEKCDDAKVLLVLFSTEYAGEYENKMLSARPKEPYIKDAGELFFLVNKVYEYSNKDDDEAQRCAKAYLSAVLGEIFLKVKMEHTDNTDIDTVRRIMLYCSEHYKENINIKSVAENNFVSGRYVTKIFSEKIGLSFRKYINMLRVAEAKTLMRNNTMRIIDIMYESGFENQSSFNRVFYDETGLTPREYRKIM